MNQAQGQTNEKVTFINVWGKKLPEIESQVLKIWKELGGLTDSQCKERLNQLAFVVLNGAGEVVGISTAFKTFIKQLNNYLYAFRCIILPESRIPGMDAKLLVVTRDFLESIHKDDERDISVGVITLVENPGLKQRNHAIWPASQMVYIGNSKNGSHIRVYYFKGARI
jgi:hypothetical protein